jgi:hypothetical protein
VTPAAEIRHLRGDAGGEDPPPDHELDELRFPGGKEVLGRAREVMEAVLAEGPLPAWFVEQCVDDAAIQTCTLDRWSLRAWKFWLAPENRRWWWWSAALADDGRGGEEVCFAALVRSRPYLKGSLEWLFKAAANA